MSGRGRYFYRAIDRDGQVIVVMLSEHPDAPAAHRFFARALLVVSAPVEVVTDKAKAYPAVIDELAPQAFHNTKKYANNKVEAHPGRLKSRLRPMRGLQTNRTARVIVTGHSFVQNLRRGVLRSSPRRGTKRPSRRRVRRTRLNDLIATGQATGFRHQHRLASLNAMAPAETLRGVVHKVATTDDGALNGTMQIEEMSALVEA